MRFQGGRPRLSASDLPNHLGCHHPTALDLEAVHGRLSPPTWRDPSLEVLQQRGLEHEGQYLDHLRDHKHLRSTNLLERLNEEIKRRTRVVRIFPNPDSCLRLVRALCAEIHEGWLEDHRYLNMDYLKEQKKELMQTAA